MSLRTFFILASFCVRSGYQCTNLKNLTLGELIDEIELKSGSQQNSEEDHYDYDFRDIYGKL